MNGCKETQLEEDWEVINSYSRAEAIADGVLVDVSDMANEAGFRYPVALTRTVWEQYVKVPEGVGCQSEDGRLWDVLFMTRYAIQNSPRDANTVKVRLSVRNDNVSSKRVELKAVVSGGDEGEPVITIMLPNED